MNTEFPKWLKVTNAAEADAAEIILSGFIGENWWDGSGNSAKSFRNALNSIPKGRKINLKINSEGGVVQDALEMYDMVRARRDDITTQIIGYACSAASWLGLSAGRVVTTANALWMIHKTSSMTAGNADDHVKSAEMLQKHDESIAGMIAQFTGKSVSEVTDAMAKETWFTGQEAKDYGLAQDVLTDGEGVNSSNGRRSHVLNILAAAAKEGTQTKPKTGMPGPDASGSPTAVPPTPEAIPPVTAQAAKLSAANGGEGTALNAADTQTTTKPKMDKTTTLAADPKPDAKTDPNLDTQNGAELMKQITAANEKNDALEQRLKVLENPPLNTRRVEVVGNAHDKLIDLKLDTNLEPAELTKAAHNRHRHLVNAWSEIKGVMEKATADGKTFEAFNGKVVNSNTIASTLTTGMLSTTAYTILQNKLAALQAIFLQVSEDRLKPRAKVEVPKTTVGPTAQTSPTDWESGDATVTNTEITPLEYSASINLSNADLQNGSRMEWLTYITAQSFANKIIDVLLTPVTTANYGAAVLTAAAAAFGPGDLPTLLGAAKDFNMKNLVLDGAYTARLTPTSTLGLNWANGSAGFGFDKVLTSNRWSAAGANVVGFVADPLGLVGAAGLPIDPPGVNAAFNSLESATIPQINFPVQLATWVKPGTRVLWMAYDAFFGVQTGDTNGLKLVTSA